MASRGIRWIKERLFGKSGFDGVLPDRHKDVSAGTIGRTNICAGFLDFLKKTVILDIAIRLRSGQNEGRAGTADALYVIYSSQPELMFGKRLAPVQVLTYRRRQKAEGNNGNYGEMSDRFTTLPRPAQLPVSIHVE